MQELQKAALHDPRLQASQIYLTRDFAHWSSPLPMRGPVKHMAQISETFTAGHAAVVPLFSAAAPEPKRLSTCRLRIPAISAPSCAPWRGSEISAAC